MKRAKKPAHGGAREGAGRKATDGTEGPFIPKTVSIRANQADDLAALGGSAWIRAQIDAAAISNKK
jgi:hypothetical protein